MSAAAALADATARLQSPLDAELLLAHVLKVTRTEAIARGERALSAAEQRDYAALVVRRARGEPLAYLTGRREFWSLELEVTHDVLVPRPETELLVEWGRSLAPQSVLDLGTGSGAIAIALARELPEAKVAAVDLSRGALTVARRNAERHGVRIEFFEGSWWRPIGSRRFDLIVSNPPYVAEGDPHLKDLQFEPEMALVAGAAGLDALRLILMDAPDHLKPGGWVLVEHGATQGEAVRALFKDAELAAIETRRDLAGLERATAGQLWGAGER